MEGNEVKSLKNMALLFKNALFNHHLLRNLIYSNLETEKTQENMFSRKKFDFENVKHAKSDVVALIYAKIGCTD